MGWGRMLLLGNVGQQLDIGDTQEAIADLAARVRDTAQVSHGVTQDLQRLQQENDELKLYLTAVIRLLSAKAIITPSELREIVEAVDRSDGASDGKFSGPLPPSG